MSYVTFKSGFTGTSYVMAIHKIRRLLFTSETITDLSDAYVIGVPRQGVVVGDSHLIRMIDKFPVLPWPLYSEINKEDLSEYTNEELIEILLMENM